VSNLLSSDAYSDAMKWEQAGQGIGLGHKIRVTFTGLKPKTGYAYKEEGAWLGVRYTWRSMRWWSLLSYNNPLVKLEVQDMSEQGVTTWRTVWEKIA